MVFLVAMALAGALAGASAWGPEPGPTCAAMVRAHAGFDGREPAPCRSLMGLALGMTMPEVMSRLGPADARDGPTPDGTLSLAYVFPRGVVTQGRRYGPSAAPPSYGVLYVVLQRGRVVDIRSPGLSGGGAARYAGVRAGDSVAALRAAFGEPEHVNRSQDAYFYAPFPLVVTVDPDTETVDGFELASSPDALGLGGTARLEAHWDAGRLRRQYSLSYPRGH